MDALKLEGQFNFPSIDFNPNTGLLKISGRSIPENPVKFYQPLENWIVEFIKTNPKDLILSIYLDYLNTHSTECVLILMKKIENFYKDKNANVKVLWSFDEDDEDMEYLGEDLASIVTIPFDYKVVMEED
jgi:hypothetical protein